jgi:hypothetical protein
MILDGKRGSFTVDMNEGTTTKFEILAKRIVHTKPNALSSGLSRVVYLLFQVQLAKDLSPPST